PPPSFFVYSYGVLRDQNLLSRRQTQFFLRTNSFPAIDKYVFGVPNSLPTFDKCEFGATNSFPAIDKHEFGAANSFSALDSTPSDTSDDFAQVGKRHQIAPAADKSLHIRKSLLQ
ncbi:MAG: hypothetical protein K2J50_06530, partial [Treponemataceae bacterium]|nr:hypothetical protein [Treponemataceae bacterium]